MIQIVKVRLEKAAGCLSSKVRKSGGREMSYGPSRPPLRQKETRIWELK